jgi:hypothetical protein
MIAIAADATLLRVRRMLDAMLAQEHAASAAVPTPAPQPTQRTALG